MNSNRSDTMETSQPAPKPASVPPKRSEAAKEPEPSEPNSSNSEEPFGRQGNTASPEHDVTSNSTQTVTDRATASQVTAPQEQEPSAPQSPAVESSRALVPVPVQPARPSLVRRLFAALWPAAAPTLRSDLETALEGAGEGDFSPEEKALLKNILELRGKRVEDVMIPRGDIVALEAETTLADALVCFEESGHSRLPVYGETLDDPLGMVHIRDVMDHIVQRSRGRRRKPTVEADETGTGKVANGKGSSAKGPNGRNSNSKLPRSIARLDLSRLDLERSVASAKLLREVLFVPPSMPAVDLMALMQARRIQMALVIDEYGGTDGLASLEDVVEVIVGDIEDEHDDAEEMIVETGPGVFEIDGRAEIEEVERSLGVPLGIEDEGEIDTLGGLIFVRLGRVPARGEVVQVLRGHEFQILEADARRIRRVRVTKSRARARARRRAEGARSDTRSDDAKPAGVGD